jgi:hypothetical protein
LEELTAREPVRGRTDLVLDRGPAHAVQNRGVRDEKHLFAFATAQERPFSMRVQHGVRSRAVMCHEIVGAVQLGVVAARLGKGRARASNAGCDDRSKALVQAPVAEVDRAELRVGEGACG